MSPFPNQAQAIRAWHATQDALNLAQDAPASGYTISIFFKNLLLQGLKIDDIVLDSKPT